jgi:hypothetical protein
MTASHDSLLELFMELRRSRPPVYLANEWASWLQAIGQTIAALRMPERRWAWTLIASNLSLSMPGLPLAMAFGVVGNAVRNAAIKECV